MPSFCRPSLRLSRRTLLRGAGSFAVALPSLEIMTPERRAQGQVATTPRFVLAYGGVSTGAYQPQDQLVPDTEGPGYDIKRALLPISELGIQEDVSVVTGLEIPWSTTDSQPVPPGGRSRFFHFNTTGPQVSGMATPSDRDGAPKGPTADQIVADAIAGDTAHRVLAYRVQAAAEFTNAGRLSWRREEGRLVAQDPIVSPRLAYQSLFGNFTPPSADPTIDAQAEFLLKQRRSVLDFVGSEASTLAGKLGQADRIRLERHLDEIRALEARLSSVSLGPSQASCQTPTAPGDDPPLSSGANWGYNGETERADVMTDLIAMAFACDLSRVASFMITEWKCYMNMNSLLGIDSDMHELTHGAGPLESISDSVAWMVAQWGKLIVKLKQLPEAGGGSVLDQTALALVFEGGHGYDPESDKQNAAHSTENMSALIAGHAGGLRAGQHVRAPGGHPAQVVLSAMNAVGVVDTALGEVEGNIPALFA